MWWLALKMAKQDLLEFLNIQAFGISLMVCVLGSITTRLLGYEIIWSAQGIMLLIQYLVFRKVF